MKRYFLLLAFLSCAAPLFSQTLFTYGNNAVDKQEFLKAYNKNKTAVTDKEASLREYLDLYTKFKLKVRAAQDIRLDTLPLLQTDIQNFRTQVEDSYMNNEKAVDELIEQAFSRSQKDLHIYHFFIPMDSTTADTVKAWQAMNELTERLKADNTIDNDKLGHDISMKYLKIKQNDLGFLTVFAVPYEYENIIYNLKPGQASMPYRSKNGLHVFKLIEERPTAGRWKIAQLMFSFPPDGENDPAIKRKADSAYKLLNAGADFASLAKNLSDDKMTYLTGGEMPEFGSGKFQPEFEKKVFALKKDGDYTAPFATSFGYHIVKRLKQTPTVADRNDAGYQYELKQKILQDNRMNAAKEKFAKAITLKVNYKRNTAVKDAELFRYADSIVKNPTAAISTFPVSNKTIFTTGTSAITGADWLVFIRDYKATGELYSGESNPALLDKFLNMVSLAYYRKHLEEYNAEFRYQMKEFKEGNMLFEIMERNVWGNASQDTVALLKLYTQNKTKYRWAPSATVILFNCTNATIAEQARAAIVAGKDWKEAIQENSNALIADSGRYEIAQIPAAEGTIFTRGLLTPVLANTVDGSASFVRVLLVHGDNEQRSFDDAKGLVINDYQAVVEEKWVNELKKKYPVKVNEEVFRSMLQ